MPNGLEGLNSAALLLCVAFLAYVVLILVPFLRERPTRPGDPEDFAWHFIVPCLDEERVIARTVRTLLSQRASVQVWCVDDASSDHTLEILETIAGADPRLHIVQRQLPDARQGKGPGLNAGWHALRGSLGPDVDRHRVIVGVVDADGRLDPDAYKVLAGRHYFGTDTVGAVQIQVRMVNRGEQAADGDDPAAASRIGRLLVTLQDLEFRTVISAMQILRRHTASVGMGGNGQFTRLSTLDEIAASAGTPWHGALLEDFELGVHILLAGYRTEYANSTWVAQEGLTSLRPLLRQRSRWGQGAMQCSRYMPAIMKSPRIGTPAAVEMSYFLFLPWMQVLGTLVYFAGTGVMIYYAITTLGGFSAWFAGGGWGVAILIALFGIAPFALWGFVYRARCAPHLSRSAALGLGLANWIYSYAHAVAIWIAFWRLVRSRNDWVKTERVTRPRHRAGMPAPAWSRITSSTASQQ